MNYYSNRLPSAFEIQQFRLNRLSGNEMEWMNHLIQTNPMVAAAVGVSDDLVLADVKSVSAKVSEKVVDNYLSKVGFWTKYGSWISLSGIALLIGLASILYSRNSIVPQYAQQSFNFDSPEKNNSFGIVDVQEDKKKGTQKDIKEEKVENIAVKPEEADQKIDSFLAQNTVEVEKEIEPPIIVDPKSNYVIENPTTLNAGNAVEAVTEKTVIIANVSLLAKLNPDEYKVTRTANTGRDPLNSTSSRSGNKQFSIADMPSYPGGDQALMDYFKGKLSPVKTYSNVKYDKAVMIKLVINARGKVKEHAILGNPHPDHLAQLEKAISSIPKFNNGKGNKVEYNLGLSFN